MKTEKRVRSRRSGAERRQADRRSGEERRLETIQVDFEQRLGVRRFVERRAEVRRLLNDRRHLLQ